MLQKPKTGGLTLPGQPWSVRPDEEGFATRTCPLRPAIPAFVLGLTPLVVGGEVRAFRPQVADDGGGLVGDRSNAEIKSCMIKGATCMKWGIVEG